MKTVYDEETQKQIDLYENRQVEILEEIKKELETATGQARFLALKELHPYCNPISLYNPEYEAINNALFRIRALAVPKYLLSKEEYEMMGNIKAPIREHGCSVSVDFSEVNHE